MPQDSELHLVIPGLCGPLAETQSLNASPAVEQWIRTLSRALRLSSSGNTGDVITEISGLNIQGDFPSAAFMLLANDIYHDSMFYMQADPVHLQADMDHAVLTPAVDLDISESEASALCDTLNRHFAQDRLKFLLLNKDQWIVSSENGINISTTSLNEATGRNINFILPEGEGAMRWRQILTEAQMLMHVHEVNTARENSGCSSINSLWFHGTGELASPDIIGHAKEFTAICSNDEVLGGVAKLMNCDHLRIPESVTAYTDYLTSCDQGAVNVLYLTELEHLVNYTDTRPWLSQFTGMLEHWVYPLIDFSKKNNINVTLYPCNENKYQFSKYDSLKFWRKDKLEKHVSSY